jgi:ankyrin repeat protein
MERPPQFYFLFTTTGNTELMKAVASGKKDICKSLLDGGADPNEPSANRSKETPLHKT